MTEFEKWWESGGGGICGKDACQQAWNAALLSRQLLPPTQPRGVRQALPNRAPLATRGTTGAARKPATRTGKG
jgi:hypothetical protein